MKRKWTMLFCVLATLTALHVACVDDGKTPSSPSLGDKGDPAIETACLSALQAAVIGTEAVGAVNNGTQLEDDFDYKTCSSQVGVCRVYVKWVGYDDVTYKWDDNYSGASGCTDYPAPVPPSYVEDSVDRLVAALSSPMAYHLKCFVAENPVTGEMVYSITFDDATNPCGGSGRRNVVIWATPA